MVACVCKSNTLEAKKVDSWSSSDNQTSRIKKLQVNPISKYKVDANHWLPYPHAYMYAYYTHHAQIQVKKWYLF